MNVYELILLLFPAWALALAWTAVSLLLMFAAYRRVYICLVRYHFMAMAFPFAMYGLFYILAHVGGIDSLFDIQRAQAFSRITSAWIITTIGVIIGAQVWTSRR